MQQFRDLIKHDFLALRTKRYTYIKYCEGERELYDNWVDPYQLNSLLPQPPKNPNGKGYAPVPFPASQHFIDELDARIAALQTCNPAACQALENMPFVFGP